jgi:hypothetical protein
MAGVDGHVMKSCPAGNRGIGVVGMGPDRAGRKAGRGARQAARVAGILIGVVGILIDAMPHAEWFAGATSDAAARQAGSVGSQKRHVVAVAVVVPGDKMDVMARAIGVRVWSKPNVFGHDGHRDDHASSIRAGRTLVSFTVVAHPVRASAETSRACRDSHRVVGQVSNGHRHHTALRAAANAAKQNRNAAAMRRP